MAVVPNDATDLGWPRTWNWTPVLYEQYLMPAVNSAPPTPRTPAGAVETTLLEPGKTLR